VNVLISSHLEFWHCLHTQWPHVGSGVVRIDPLQFAGRMLYKATKPGLVSVLYLSMHYTVLLFIRASFYISLVFVAMYSVFWLFWLSVFAKWLARKAPLRKHNRGKGIVSRRGRAKSACDFLGLLYTCIVLLCICVDYCPYVI